MGDFGSEDGDRDGGTKYEGSKRSVLVSQLFILIAAWGWGEMTRSRPRDKDGRAYFKSRSRSMDVIIPSGRRILAATLSPRRIYPRIGACFRAPRGGCDQSKVMILYPITSSKIGQ